MSEQEAFEQWHTNKYLAKEFGALTLQAAWQAALEWARSEQEPVACIGTNGELMWLNRPQVVYSKPIPLYTHPAPAVAVNEQLLEALKVLVENGGIGPEQMFHDARAAIAAAESAKSREGK